MKTKENIRDDYRMYRAQIDRDGWFLKGQLIFSLILIFALLIIMFG